MQVQADHMAKWKTVLTPYAYECLCGIRDRENATRTSEGFADPYLVWRGVDIDNAVSNLCYKLRAIQEGKQ